MVELIVLGAFALSLFVCVGLGVSILYALILGFVLFCGYGVYRGHGLREMLSLALSGIRTVKGILLTFLLIGVITALWRRSGTIAFIICRSLDLCGERVMLPAAFLLCALISYLTGTAFGTAATMGVICAALAAGMGIPTAYIGGAVLSGSYFGDRCSPMSTSALLVSSLTGTDIYRNLGGMVKTSLVPFFVSVALYALIGLGLHSSYDVSQMQALFSGAFKLTPPVLLPAAVIVLLSLFKVNVKAAMGVSILCSAAICIFVQGAAPAELISDAVFGFQPGSQQLSALLGGGGILSMARVFFIVCISSCYPGMLGVTGLLDRVQDTLAAFGRRTTAFCCILVCSIFTSIISCNQTLAVMLKHQLCLNVEPDRRRLALDLENTVIVVAPLIPWSIAGAVPLAAIGAPEGSLLFSFYLYLIPLCCLARSFLARHMERRAASS